MTQLNIQIPEKLQFIFQPMRYKVAFGGRGSAKTITFARAAIIRAQHAKTKILCTREYQKSIRDSVMSVIKGQITALGLDNQFIVGETYIRGVNGSEFVFTGLHRNYAKIKGLHDADICWLEEAENVTEDSLQVITPTIRKKGSEIWISFNPRYEWDAVYKRYVLGNPPDCIAVKINWRDNPWFKDTELVNERENDFLTLPTALYNWKWEGECLQEGSMAFFTVQEIRDAMDDQYARQMARAVMGIDPSMGLNDGTAFAWRYGNYIDTIEIFHNMDEMACVAQADSYLSLGHIDKCFIDAMVGSAIKGRLTELGHNNIQSVNFAATDFCAMSQEYANNRIAMYGNLRKKLREGDPIRLPKDDLLFEELAAVRWKPTSNGKMILEPKNELTARIGRSPDRSDALALCFTPYANHAMMRASQVRSSQNKYRRLYG